MLKLVLILVGFIICAISTVMCFDARSIAAKNFSTGEINEATKTIKIIGYTLSMIGILIIYLNTVTI